MQAPALKYRISAETPYVYHKLSEPSKGSTAPYNMFGVIIDSSAPYIKNKCTCSIKMIDDTLNNKCAKQIAGGKSMINIQMTLFANTTNDLPTIFRIGDIIRVHRVGVGDYQGQLQLNGNVMYKTSWIIFSGNPDFDHEYYDQKNENNAQKKDDGRFIRLLDAEEEEKFMQEQLLKKQKSMESEESKESEIQKYNGKLPEKEYTPIASSSQTYSFNESEKAVIDKLRKWSQDFFKGTQIYDTETHIQGYQIAQDGTQYFRDFDLLGKLMTIDPVDDKFCNVQVKDLSGVVYQIRLNLGRLKIPQKGQIIRVRSVKLSSGDQFKGTTKDPIKLDLSNPSNVLHIPQYFKQALMLNERIIEDDVLKRLILCNDEILKEPQIISSLQQKHQDMNYTNLYDIFHSYHRDKIVDNFLRVKVFCIGMLPQNIREMTQLYCQKCVKTSSFKEIECDINIPLDKQVYNCPFCGETGQPIYQLCLICKDDSTSNIDKCYKLLYYSHDTPPEQEFFGGLKATNLYRDELSRERIGSYIRIIARFNVYLDLVVKRKFIEAKNEEVFLIVDGKIYNYHSVENDKQQ